MYWPALILAPTLTLTNLSLTYALVTPACKQQSTLYLHLTSLASLLLILAWTWMAWRRRSIQRHPASSDSAGAEPQFMASVAVLTGGNSALVIVAQWIPQWLMSPCTA